MDYLVSNQFTLLISLDGNKDNMFSNLGIIKHK